MKLVQVLPDFAADLRLAGRSEHTVSDHVQRLDRLAAWLDAQGMDWQQLTARQLKVWLRPMAARAFSTRSNMFCTLRVFFAWAIDEGYISLSPAANLKTPSKPEPLPRALNASQIRKLQTHLDSLRTSGLRQQRDATLIYMGLYAGLRAGEYARLRWTDIDPTAEALRIGIAKPRKGRAIHLHAVLVRLLEEWRIAQGGTEDWPVFSLNETPITAERVGKICRRVARESGVPFTSHQLRHTFATWGYRFSRDIVSVQKALGHSTLTQTMIYVASDPEDSRGAVDALPDPADW